MKCPDLRNRVKHGSSCVDSTRARWESELGSSVINSSHSVGGPTMTGKAGLVPWNRLYIKQLPPTASAAAEPLPWPLGLYFAGYKYKITHTLISLVVDPHRPKTLVHLSLVCMLHRQTQLPLVSLEYLVFASRTCS